MSLLFKSARIGAAAVLPAGIMFWLASADKSSDVSGGWLILAPVGWFAVIAVGWLDGLRTMALTAGCCGVIFAVAAYAERDNRPLPFCAGVLDYRVCKADAHPEHGVGAALWVFVPGGAAALISARRRKRFAST